MYKPKSYPSYSKTLQQREDYANQTWTKPISHAKAKTIAAEEYNHDYVVINPDTDKPDQEEIALHIVEDDPV